MISKVDVRKNSSLEDEVVNLIKTHYLNSFQSRVDFCHEFDISTSLCVELEKKYSLKKDRSKYNPSRNEATKKERLLKTRATKLAKYGDATYNNTSKFKKTCLAKYGVEHPSQLQEVKEKKKSTFNSHFPKNSKELEDLKKKKNNKHLINFGDKVRATRKKHQKENPSFLEEVNLKRKQTCLSKYGVENISQLEEVKKKKAALAKKDIDEFMQSNNCTHLKDVVNKYGQSFLPILDSFHTFYFKGCRFVSNEDLPEIEKYTKINRSSFSKGEKEIFEFIKSFYEGNVIENDRCLIKPKELDIYIPDKRVAIEFNGVYWHSLQDKTYHLDKTKACESKGVRLIHIFNNDWYTKRAICESIIKAALGKYNRRIYARECICQKIDSETYRSFLKNNHLQGSVNSSLRLGLYYKGELVQVAGWGKSRFKKDEVELHRMCTLLNTQVIGGFSKLIKHSSLTSFVSYVDRSLYDGRGYLSSGFKLIDETPPSYFYFKNKKFNRITLQKHKLKNLIVNYDSSLTEEENLVLNNFVKVYDCGNLKMKYEV